MADDFAVVTLKNAPGKKVRIPRSMLATPLAARGYVVETGQATWAEVNGEAAADPGVNSGFEAAMIQAGKAIDRFGSNIRQAAAGVGGDDANVQDEIARQAEMERLTYPASEQFPKSSFAGEMLPFFAVPGGPAAQVAFGAATGALEGDTAAERLGGAALGAGAARVGQKVGDALGARTQNFLQRIIGRDPAAGARNQLIRSNVPMSISERTSGPISKPLARFFERGRFVLTGKNPANAKAEQQLTKLITEAFGVDDVTRLNREGLGAIKRSVSGVFRDAADRAGGKIAPDDAMLAALDAAEAEFRRVGSDSPQVSRIFRNALREIRNAPGDGLDADVFLKLRSKLSEATTKTDLETSAVVDAMSSFDEQLARLNPDLADDLITARDRWRMLLALRRGRAISPQGEINITTFNNNIGRFFRDFDVGTPLPRSLGEAGEAVAAFNEVSIPFRSSGTAENAAALGIPIGGFNTDTGALVRGLAGLAAPFAGGGTGGLLGGGAARAGANNLQQLIGREIPDPEI